MTSSGLAASSIVLVVGMANSVHLARWVNMSRGRELRFVLLPIFEGDAVPELYGTKRIATASDLESLEKGEVGVFDSSVVPQYEVDALDHQLGYVPWRPGWLGTCTVLARPAHLAAAIRLVRPAIVHSMEVQFAGYLCLATRRHLGAAFPFWLLSNWGSDIFLYRKQPEHHARLAEIARTIDGYLAECGRDNAIVREMGYAGEIVPPMPASGGADVSGWPDLASLPPPSARREILIKGYHGWSGRALHILAAVHLAAPHLRGFAIRVTLAQASVAEMVAELACRDGLDIACEPFLGRHDDALGRLARARIVVGLGISDGISTTLLEAMSLGVFPIQGTASCGNEWVVPDRTGFLVSPHDPAALARALIRAAEDDALVDEAAAHNRAVVERRWNAAINGEIALAHYRRILGAKLRRTERRSPEGLSAEPTRSPRKGPRTISDRVRRWWRSGRR